MCDDITKDKENESSETGEIRAENEKGLNIKDWFPERMASGRSIVPHGYSRSSRRHLELQGVERGNPSMIRSF